MFKNIWFLSFLFFFIGGLLAITVSQTTNENNYSQTTSNNGSPKDNKNTNNSQVAKKNQSSGIIMVIAKKFMVWLQHLYQMSSGFINNIIDFIILEIMNILQFLTTSNNTAMTRRPRSINYDDYYQSKSGNSIAAKVSELFMLPFKLGFGLLRFIPISSIFDRIIFKPIEGLSDNPVVQAVMNITYEVGDRLADETWEIAKKNILPRLNALGTQLKESHALPQSVDNYITELQTAYQVMQFLGVA